MAPKGKQMSTATAKSKKTVVVKSMGDLAALALSKFSMPKSVRKNITVGEHKVDETIRIVGTVTVGKDYNQKIVNALPIQKLLMKLASQVSQERLVEMLSPESLDAISDKEVEDFSERIKGEWEKLSKSTTTTCKGKVTAKLIFTKE
jgi:hypothetical protein